MNGHWLSGTRKLNKHYQSGDSKVLLDSSVDYTVGSYGNHYVGLQDSTTKGYKKFNKLVIGVRPKVATGNIELRYYPNVMYRSIDLVLALTANVLTSEVVLVPTGYTPTDYEANILCPSNGTSYQGYQYINSQWVVVEPALTVDYSTPNEVTISGFTNNYGYYQTNLCVFGDTASDTYTVYIHT